MRHLAFAIFIISILTVYAYWFQPQQPYVYAGEDRTVRSNEAIFLKAHSSTQLAITKEWRQLFGKPVTIIKNAESEVIFNIDSVNQDSLFIFEYRETYKGGIQATDTITIKVEDDHDIEDIIFTMASPIRVGQTCIIHIETQLDTSNFSVIFNHQPINSSITPVIEDNRIFFSPAIPGHYEIDVSDGTASRQLAFTVQPEFPVIDSNIISLNNYPDNPEKSLGIIRNQFWVHSNSQSKSEMINMLADFSELKIMGFDALNGLLISLDTEDINAIQQLEQLALLSGITSILPRLHEGRDVDRIEQKSKPFYTNDYTSWSSIKSENWHLLAIDAPLAWTITQGHEKVLIGVSDGGFDTTHKELQGKISANFIDSNNTYQTSLIDHGTAVAGSIVAISHNKFGISGINFKSKLVLHSTGFNAWNTLAKQKEVKVVSASWAIPGYIPDTLDMDNPSQKNERMTQAYKLSRNFRAIAKQHPDKLFIFSSGNGIGNGKGYKGIYAVEGNLHSPALHLSAINTVDKVDNVMFVSALTNKGILSFNSSYGQLIDIAAPSYYKSLASKNSFKKSNSHHYGMSTGFGGTSAAAPIVAGVASLVYSIHPELSGADVKRILIKSSRKKTIERFSSPTLEKKRLKYPIPIVNAHAAVQMANAMLIQPIEWSQKPHDPFQPRVNLEIKGLPTNALVISGTHKLEDTNGTDTDTLDSSDKTLSFDLEGLADIHSITSEISYMDNTGKEQEVTISHSLNMARVIINMTDHDDDQLPDNIMITVESMEKQAQFHQGKYTINSVNALNLVPGSYKIHTQHANYFNTTTLVHLSDDETFNLDIELIKMGEVSTGIITGTIMTSQYETISNAKVKLYTDNHSGPADTFAISNQEGVYRIEDIPETNSMNHLVAYYLDISAEGYESVTLPAFAIISGQTINNDVLLYKINTQEANKE